MKVWTLGSKMSLNLVREFLFLVILFRILDHEMVPMFVCFFLVKFFSELKV